MTKWLKIAMIMLAALALTQCNIFESDSTSASALIVISITGQDLLGNTDSPVIFSDVASETDGIINDNATATLNAQLINPDPNADVTYYHSILVDQIDVEYSRSDGLNQEGRDIPFAFSQKVNIQVDIDTTVELPFVIVQHVAKLEPPLIDLASVGDEQVLKLEAKCTFHGKDLGGHRIQPVVGTVSVWCANFADEDQE